MLFLGIDIGTSSVRCSVIDLNKNPVAQTKAPLATPESPANGYFQQDATLWADALTEALVGLTDKIDCQQIKAISVDATSSTVLLTDADNHPLTPALMYNDSRGQDYPEKLKNIIPPENIALSSTSSLAKSLWLLGSLDSTTAVRYIAHQADWINAWLTEKPGYSDVNNTLKTGYDCQQMCWPDWITAIKPNISGFLADVDMTGKVIGKVSANIAKRFSFSPETLVFRGTTDSTASVLATGISQPGDAVTTLGTTMVMKVISENPVESLTNGVYSHRLPSGLWLVGGASNSGGNVLLKYFDHELIAGLSAKIDINKPTNLNFYPLSTPGERFPVNDPHLAPRLLPRPESDIEFLQAIFEGFANIEKMAYEKIARLGGNMPNRIVTAGGGAAHNSTLCAIRQKSMDIPMETATYTEASYGMALVARSSFLDAN